MTHLGRQRRCNGGVPRAPPRWENGNYSGSAPQLFIYLFFFQVWNSRLESFEVDAHASEEEKEDLRALGYRLENEFGFVVPGGPCQDAAKQEGECGFSQRGTWEEGKSDCWGDQRFELLRQQKYCVIREKEGFKHVQGQASSKNHWLFALVSKTCPMATRFLEERGSLSLPMSVHWTH